jgi:nucleoid-associated protein YgaU
VSGTSGSVTDPLVPLVAALALAAWACSGWLLLVALATWGSRLPGVAGRLARHTSERMAPASVRTLVRVALGATVAASVVGVPSAAFADKPRPAAKSYDWPSLPVASDPAPTFDWPSIAPTPTPADAHPTTVPTTRPIHVAAPHHTVGPDLATRPHGPVRLPATSPDALVVQPGDSLWAIAARHLGPAASEAQIAQAWPQWWSANRTVVGDDPDLIQPGTHLAPPSHG